eukprot:SAG22_NODE_313_length_12610_cov_5.778275_4_plen_508_part_00
MEGMWSPRPGPRPAPPAAEPGLEPEPEGAGQGAAAEAPEGQVTGDREVHRKVGMQVWSVEEIGAGAAGDDSHSNNDDARFATGSQDLMSECDSRSEAGSESSLGDNNSSSYFSTEHSSDGNASDSGGYVSDGASDSGGYTSDGSSGYASDASSGYASSDGEGGPRPSRRRRSIHRAHPLHHAASSGDIEGVKRLIGSGEPMNGKDKYSCTPLHRAAHSGQCEAVNVLLRAGADATIANDQGQTPLHRACMRGRASVVAALLNAGAPPSVADRRGVMPLHYAARSGHTEAVERLLNANADADAADNDRQTAMHKACHHGRRQTVYILLGYTRWPLAVNSDGKDARQLAVEQNEDEVLELLDSFEKTVDRLAPAQRLAFARGALHMRGSADSVLRFLSADLVEMVGNEIKGVGYYAAAGLARGGSDSQVQVRAAGEFPLKCRRAAYRQLVLDERHALPPLASCVREEEGSGLAGAGAVGGTRRRNRAVKFKLEVRFKLDRNVERDVVER